MEVKVDEAIRERLKNRLLQRIQRSPKATGSEVSVSYPSTQDDRSHNKHLSTKRKKVKPISSGNLT